MAGLPGREHPMETVERAEELWCVDGLSMGDVAARVGVAVSTVKRWAEKYGWHAKREEIRQALASIRVDTIKLRAKLIANCLDSMQAMDAFAVAKMEEVAIKAAELADKRAEIAPAPSAPAREITSEADAVAALEEALAIKLNAMLASPGQIDLRALQDVKKCMDFLGQLRAAGDTAAPSRKRGISLETAEKIRRDILGVSE